MYNTPVFCFVCFWKNKISRTKEGLAYKERSFLWVKVLEAVKFKITAGICWDLVRGTLLYCSSEAHHKITSWLTFPAAAWGRSVPS